MKVEVIVTSCSPKSNLRPYSSKVANEGIWVFVGTGGLYPSGVFSTRDGAEGWIRSHRLTGTLTLYPVDVGVYDWAIGNEYFEPKRPHESTPEFIGRFSCASLEHYHYEEGEQ